MPITTDFSRFEVWSRGFKSGEWLGRAIDQSLDVIDYNLKVPVDTGQMSAAFANRVPASGIGLNRSGGIGNMAMVGEPTRKAPKHTISEFLKWYRKNAQAKG